MKNVRSLAGGIGLERTCCMFGEGEGMRSASSFDCVITFLSANSGRVKIDHKLLLL